MLIWFSPYISWTSSNPAVVSNTGIVTTPASGSINVTLTARITKGTATLTKTFTVTDTLAGVPVTYTGILPDLFREGQGVVTEGAFVQGSSVFVADTVLAKHDETYMPKDVADRLKAQGVELSGKETIK